MAHELADGERVALSRPELVKVRVASADQEGESEDVGEALARCEADDDAVALGLRDGDCDVDVDGVGLRVLEAHDEALLERETADDSEGALEPDGAGVCVAAVVAVTHAVTTADAVPQRVSVADGVVDAHEEVRTDMVMQDDGEVDTVAVAVMLGLRDDDTVPLADLVAENPTDLEEAPDGEPARESDGIALADAAKTVADTAPVTDDAADALLVTVSELDSVTVTVGVPQVEGLGVADPHLVARGLSVVDAESEAVCDVLIDSVLVERKLGVAVSDARLLLEERSLLLDEGERDALRVVDCDRERKEEGVGVPVSLIPGDSVGL